MADQAAADVPADLNINELANIPLWLGKNQMFTSTMDWKSWNSKDACEWRDMHTMAFVYKALRNDALEWYGLKWDGEDEQVYQQFKDNFFGIRTSK